ncbi:hypothetical protein HYC85_000669 [Camellia sinensis]|uniref:Uncharacterized protein n=1 Tax=Camellia sinensis TaxID=4442 RepID=A0A7J7I362_CAMSI|nr:hypothetical protein HYC85_000669 [Camellia sinensis]
MVLSNKKLKQKLRVGLAESLTASEANNDSTKPDPNSQIQDSFKSLLDSAAQKPRLSKREKRRKTLSLHGPEDVNASGSGDLEKEIEEAGSAGVNEKKKKRKRKVDEDLERSGSGDLEKESEEGGFEVVNDKKKRTKKKKRKRDEGLESGGLEKVEAKKSKKKKKKKKKKGKKVESEQVKEGEESANGESEQGVIETIKANDSQETAEVVTKVYVGGIPYYSTEDDIRSYFESCGTITEVDCMKFPESGKFRGIAIINFKTEAAAKRALALDGSDMGGLFLKIQPYKSTRPKTVSSDFAPAIMEGYNRIYVGNLSWDITEDELRKLFSDCSISTIRFGEDKETKEFRGYAHVDFTDSVSVNMALKLDQKIVCGRPVRIRCAVPKKVVREPLEAAVPKKVVKESLEAVVPKKVVTESDSKSLLISKEADNGDASAVSGKIRRRTCYECGEKGHLSSLCPNKQADDLKKVVTESDSKSLLTSKETDNGDASAVSGKIRRRTCYECGEKGHLSSSCPNKQADDLTNGGAM